MKKFLRSLEEMSKAAYVVLSFTLRLCCLMLFAAWVLLVHMGPLTPEARELWFTARELYTSPAGLLLLGGLAAVCLEERSRMGK